MLELDNHECHGILFLHKKAKLFTESGRKGNYCKPLLFFFVIYKVVDFRLV